MIGASSSSFAIVRSAVWDLPMPRSPSRPWSPKPSWPGRGEGQRQEGAGISASQGAVSRGLDTCRLLPLSLSASRAVFGGAGVQNPEKHQEGDPEDGENPVEPKQVGAAMGRITGLARFLFW